MTSRIFAFPAANSSDGWRSLAGYRLTSTAFHDKRAPSEAFYTCLWTLFPVAICFLGCAVQMPLGLNQTFVIPL